MLQVGGGYRAREEPQVLALGAVEPVRVRGTGPTFITITQHYIIQRDDESGFWKVAIAAYWYYLYEDATAAREVVAYRWHPGGRYSAPHLHPGEGMREGMGRRPAPKARAASAYRVDPGRGFRPDAHRGIRSETIASGLGAVTCHEPRRCRTRLGALTLSLNHWA